MTANFNFSSRDRMSRRRAEAEEFFDAVLDPDERPIFVSDEASLFDIFVGDCDELSDRCMKHYGTPLRSEDFGKPFWRLLDDLAERRRDQCNG